MPSTIKYLNVVFRQDKLIGDTVYPTDWETSLPDDLARAMSAGGIVSIVGPGSYDEMVARRPGGGDIVYVSETDSAETIASKIETLGDEEVNNSPQGQGRLVCLPSSGILTGPLSLSTMQSLEGTKGSTIFGFDPPLIGFGVADTAHLTLLDDSVSKNGIRGNGVLRDIDFDGNRQTWEDDNPTAVVHGYFGDDRSSGKCISHRMDNVSFSNYTGHGCYIGKGNDQLVANRLRAENNRGTALVIKSSDCKLHDLGLVSQGYNADTTRRAGALLIDGAAPEIETCDFYLPTDAECEATVICLDAQRFQFKGGTISGRTICRGRNDQGTTNRYENAAALFAGITFKHDEDLASTRFYSGVDQVYTYSSYFVSEDIDAIKLVSPRFGFDTTLSTSLLPDYLIELLTSTGNNERIGKVFISDASGLVVLTGRVGNVIKQRIGCKTHFANKPENVVFDWGIPGRPEPVPKWLVDNADPSQITHIAFDGTSRTKEDYPFGYLCATINPGGTHGTLDDVNTTFTLPELPQLSSSYVWAMRCVP